MADRTEGASTAQPVTIQVGYTKHVYDRRNGETYEVPATRTVECTTTSSYSSVGEATECMAKLGLGPNYQPQFVSGIRGLVYGPYEIVDTTPPAPPSAEEVAARQAALAVAMERPAPGYARDSR